MGGNLVPLRPLVQLLSKDFTVLTWDNRGCGESEAGGPYSLRLFADDLFALLMGLSIERCIVIGVLWGGVVAQRFALDHIDAVEALVLDSTSSVVNERAAQYWLEVGRSALAGKSSGGHPEAIMGQCQALAGLKDSPLTPALGGITCPTLVIVGENDEVAGVGGSVILDRNLPNSRLQIVPDCGHAVTMRAPVVFEREFRAFVAALPGPI